MAALGADGTPYITQAEATAVLRELFNGVHGQTDAQNANTQGLLAQLRTDVQQAVVAAQTGAEEQVESLRGHTRTAVTELEAKLASSIESMELYEAARKKGEEEFMTKMITFEQGVHGFAADTRVSIQQMIAEGRSADGTPMKPFQERDRPVFDLRNYKIDVIPTQMSLGIWKKWRHEVENFCRHDWPFVAWS